MADLREAYAIANRWSGKYGTMGILARGFLAIYLNAEPRPLTPQQAAIVRFLGDYIEERGYAPTFEEIAQRFEYRALATVHEHLSNLERKGWIRRERNEARSITMLHRLSIEDPSSAAKYAVSDPSISPEITL